MSQIPVATLGVPRIGGRRELKFALDAYWAGRISQAELLSAAARLREEHWLIQKAMGVTVIPSNDFSLYDHVLDTAVMVGAIPQRYGWTGGEVPLDTYFAMARGSQGDAGCGHPGHVHSTSALEMTKWFDTNYHYMVPELAPEQQFVLATTKPVDHFLEAKELGIHTRPVILGPVTFLRLAKSRGEEFDLLSLLPKLLPVYSKLLGRLHKAGADWVQIDEPCLVLDLDAGERAALETAYRHFSEEVPALGIMLATYFGAIGDNLDLALSLPVSGLHIDLVRAPEQLEQVARLALKNLVLSLG